MNGLIPWLRHRLPKPWLFGLYGALGGLIGATLIGEAVWWALRPPPAAGPVPTLRLAASPAVDVYKGGKNRFGIKIAKDGWAGAVTIKAEGTPAGVRIDPVTVPDDRGEIEIEVRADLGAPVGSSGIALTAQGPPGPGTPAADATMRLTVRENPPPPPGLRIGVAPGVVVDQSGKNRFGVLIARDDFRGPVTVDLSGLPAGVTAATPIVVPPDATTAEVEVRARADAPVGTGAVSVTATGPSGLPGAASPPTAFSRLELTVKAYAPPRGLRIGVSPGVVVDQGSKNRFGVVIARDNFSGPVTVELGDLPGGVTAAKTTLPDGVTTAEVEVQAAADAPGGTRTVSVTAVGPGGPPGATAPPTAFSRLDVTVNAYRPPTVMVDIMFVLDVTGSMGWAIDGVRDGIIKFAAELERRNLDVRVGLTGFRDHLAVLKSTAKGTSSSRRNRGASSLGRPGVVDTRKPLDLAPLPLIIGGEVFTKDYRAFAREVGENLSASGGGDGPESSLDALALASSHPFRQNAGRVLILITDAPPHIPDLQVPTIKQELVILRKARIDQLHLVIDPMYRPIYGPLQSQRKGAIFDLREAARGRGAFAAMLPEVSREIARIAMASQPPQPPPAAAQPPRQPPEAAAAALPPPAISAPPAPPRPLAVAAGDLPPIPPQPPVLKAVQSGQTFAVASTGRLLLAISAWTAVIAAMIAMALCVGQHHYLRQGWLHPSAALSGWIGGLIAGVTGGAAGQFLYQAAPGTLAGEAVFRILGWTLLGSLAGLVLAFFVPNLRSDRGMLGGALGGAAGALGFLGASIAFHGLPGGEIAGRILGAVLLGLALGLMLALAERMARKAWLEVCYGGGEFRTVNLGVEPVSIGSNSRAATIYARGAAPVAYRYWFLDGKVKQEDATTGAVTEVQSGEPISVGALSVTVHTAASATMTAPRTTPSPHKAPVAPTPPYPAAAGTPAVVRPIPPAQTAASAAPPPPAPAVPRAPAPAVAAFGAAATQPPPASAPSAAAFGATASQSPPPAVRQDSGTCPGCGRLVPGVPGRRYCITCDLYS